ncbi:MAG: FHA domain-containing protein [bacterium]
MDSGGGIFVLLVVMFALIIAGVTFYISSVVLQSPGEKMGVAVASLAVPVLCGTVGAVLLKSHWTGLWFAIVGWILTMAVSLLALGSFNIAMAKIGKKGAFCPDCGKALQAEWRACPYCGFEVWRQPQSVEVKIENLKRNAPAKRDTQDVAPAVSKGFYLLVKDGEDKGKVFPLNRPVLGIGRDSENDISLRDHFASGQHARVKIENETAVLYDLASTNGTRVNGKEVVKADLKEGDVVEIGKTQLTFKEQK